MCGVVADEVLEGKTKISRLIVAPGVGFKFAAGEGFFLRGIYPRDAAGYQGGAGAGIWRRM